MQRKMNDTQMFPNISRDRFHFFGKVVEKWSSIAIMNIVEQTALLCPRRGFTSDKGNYLPDDAACYQSTDTMRVR